ncbi:MAG: hypothetical protein ACFFDM_04130, partial [Candidatus Thorarchaeota archaeon]
VGIVDHDLEQIESFINGKRTIAEIMDLIGFSDEKVIALISMLTRYQWIDFKKRLTDENILIRSDCPEMALDMLKAQYGQPLEAIIEAFDGTKKVREVLDTLPYDPRAMWFIINKLVEDGCLTIQ